MAEQRRAWLDVLDHFQADAGARNQCGQSDLINERNTAYDVVSSVEEHPHLEPRFDLTYWAANHTVVHTAVALLDDHNNTLIQENQNVRLLSFPIITGSN